MKSNGKGSSRVKESKALNRDDSKAAAQGEPLTPAVRNTSVVPFDSLTAYMREIRRYPKLTREEEHELAVRYKEDKDIEAAYSLVSSNLWLVVKLAKEYERSARNLLDLIQEGNIGLMEAVKNYDPYRGVRFPSYAVWWVKAFIIRYMIANLRIVKVGTTQAQRKLFFNLHKEKEKLERMGIYPGPKLLAEKLNVKESEVVEMEQRLGSPDLSVDAPLSPDDEGGGSLLGVLASGELSSEELVERKERAEFIRKGFDDFAETLKDRERIIFQKRMLSEEKATLQELSDELSISRERVRQIENRVKEKLQKFFSERLDEQGEELDL
ncbi:MAG: RNA polymerase factor sigma-32 [Bdellovibrionales bacterium]|nr:RNA polymerase factor sigma-32 [Bdellovibrionales bacterium]